MKDASLDIIQRARQRESGAWRELYARDAQAVRRVLYGFGKLSTADVQDLLQETFVRAYEHIDQLRDDGAFRPWLLRIARSRALNRLRAAANRHKLASAFAADPAAGLMAPRQDEQLAERQARIALVRDLIDSLPAGPEAETIRLYYIEGELSARQIAERLNLGKSTVTMRLERFRAKVKARLAARLLRAGLEPI